MLKSKICVLSIFLIVFWGCEYKENNQSEIKTQSFREFMIQNHLSLDLNEKNEFESLLPGNKYSNYYFNFSTVLPDSFEIDRGNFQYTVIRGFDPSNGISISVGVTPIGSLLDSEKIQNIHNRFQESPLEYLDEKYGGNFKSRMFEVMKSNTNLRINEFRVGEKKIRSANYVYIVSEYVETYDNLDVEMIKIDYQTILWGNSFVFSCNSPKSLFNENIILDVLNQTNYIKP